MKLLPIAWMALVCSGVLGWGLLLRRFTGTGDGPRSTALGLGVAAVMWLGGLLNVFRLARPAGIVVLLVAGTLGLVVELRRVRPPEWRGRADRLELGLVVALVAAVAIFGLVTLGPPRVFNFHDDLQKYLAHPVQMLATGTLAAGPLSALGSETAGALALLQGLLLAALPLPWVGAADWVLGLLALMVVVAGAGRRRVPGAPVAVISPLLAVAVAPQIVNVSSIYCAAALMATAVLLVADDREGIRPSPLSLGLVYAALVALKPTFGLFVVLHLPLAAFALGAAFGRRMAVVWGLEVAGVVVMGLAPWIGLHLPVWLGPHTPLPNAPPGTADWVRLWSVDPLFYGGTGLHYSALVALGVVAGALALWGLRFAADPLLRRLALGVAASAGIAAVVLPSMVYVAGPELGGESVGLRYAVPMLLGAVLPAVALAFGPPGAVSRGARMALAAAALLLAAAFAPSLVDRVRLALDQGTAMAGIPALVRKPGYADYVQRSLSDETGAKVRELQGRVPEGAALLAWTNVPFHLDYRRNRVIDVAPAGLGTPWSVVPGEVRWVLWQYKDYGTRTSRDLDLVARGPGAHDRLIAARTADFGRMLEAELAGARVLVDDGEYRLFEVAGPLPARF